MNNERGSILVVTLGFILVFTLLGLGSMYLATVHNEAAEKRAASNKAFWLAEAGLQKARWEFNQHNCTGLFQEGTITACTSCTSGVCGTNNKTLAATLSTFGDYDIILDDGNMTMTATGSYPNRTAANRSQRKVQLDSGSQFKYAVFAQGQISISNGALINSYDSSVGPYGGTNNEQNGDVGTNSTNANAITIGNNATVNGDVSTGPGGTVSVGNTPVNGSTTNTNSVSLPAVVVPSTLTSLSNLGTLNVNSNTTIPAGNYKYTAINVSNNRTLTFNGNVNLYLTSTTNAFTTGNGFQLVLNSGASVVIYSDGRILLTSNSSGSNVNNLGAPLKFGIFSTYTGASGVQIANNGNFYGTVYAPATDVSITNNSQLYGAIVGKTVTLSNNTQIHYDQTLGGTINSSTRRWQEL